MKHEIQMQIRESSLLLQGRVEQYKSEKEKIPSASKLVSDLQARYDEFVTKVKSTRDEKLNQLHFQQGNLSAKLDFLNQKKATLSALAQLQNTKEEMQGKIGTLKARVETAQKAQQERRLIVDKKVSDIAKALLKVDLPREEIFQKPNSVKVDFRNNTFSVDGRNQFSASSCVYLKNSVIFSIFFTSLQHKFVRYPRFILSDNMEDKGMEMIRSQNFQKNIVRLSEAAKLDHQIIFTTSMIAPDLNNDKYCIGPYYSKTQKTLEI